MGWTTFRMNLVSGRPGLMLGTVTSTSETCCGWAGSSQRLFSVGIHPLESRNSLWSDC